MEHTFARTEIWGNVTKNFGYQSASSTCSATSTCSTCSRLTSGTSSCSASARGPRRCSTSTPRSDQAFEPVITNSMSFQLANKRPIGATFIMNRPAPPVLGRPREQPGLGLLRRDPQFPVRQLGHADTVQEDDSIFKHLGGGVGYSVGYEELTFIGPDASTSNLHVTDKKQRMGDLPRAFRSLSTTPMSIGRPRPASLCTSSGTAGSASWPSTSCIAASSPMRRRPGDRLSGPSCSWRRTTSPASATTAATASRILHVEVIRPFLPVCGQWGPVPGKSPPSGRSSTSPG